MIDRPTTREDDATPGGPSYSFVIPTLDEAGNIMPLLGRLSSVMNGSSFEIIFVDDSSDETPQEISAAESRPGMEVVLVRREVRHRWGGLGGAVVDGLRIARAPFVCVMDADLQHPPERVPDLFSAVVARDADIVVASRYRPGGASSSGRYRRFASRFSTALAKVVFSHPLRTVSDPLSGFFVLRRDAVALDRLRPNGFKVLLEILVRVEGLRVAEIGYEFAERCAGKSKASVREALSYVAHLSRLRAGAPAEGRGPRVQEALPAPNDP